MAPSPTPPEPPGALDRPVLLNEKFKVHSYDGGSFKSRAQYDVKNALIPIIEPFHCSGSGTKFTLVLKCSEDFTLSHFYLSGPGPRCTEPIRSGLVWVVDQPPENECLKKYDAMSSEELMEIMKGLRTYSSCDEAGGLPDPCVYFTTDPTSREAEVELAKWREGRYVVIKFLDTHKDQVNIDVGIIAMIGYFGRKSKLQVPLGPWMRRSSRQVWVHPNPLKSMFSSSGWVCDGRDFTGGCRSGQTDFHQTSVYTVTFRCTTSGFDLCEKCAFENSLGKVTENSLQADLEALSDPAMCKLAVTRIRNQWRRNWLATLPMYFQGGLLDSLVQALQRSTESSGRPEEERAAMQRQQSGAETQKRQVRRALLQLTTELTHKLLALGPGSDIAVNDLVWALCPEPEEHWDEGRVIQLPKSLPPAMVSQKPAPCLGGASSASASDKPSESGGASADASGAASEADGAAPATATSAEKAENEVEASPSSYMVSWRDGQAPGRVEACNLWKITANEDVMMASANLFMEVSKGEACDPAKVAKLLQQGSGADLMATNGEGCTALLAAVRGDAPVEVVATLLDNGACPDASGRDGVTPLMQVMHLQKLGLGDSTRLTQIAELLLKHGAVMPEDTTAGDRLAELRETFGLKMVGALLSLQSPMALPMEVLEVLHLLLRELPLDVLKKALEPQAFRALTALLQHLVGGTDNLSTALTGCRIMRAIYSRQDPTLQYLVRSHGALRWSQRLSTTKDVAQCGLYRQQHHEKVTPEELSKEAKALYDELCADSQEGDEGSEEWRANARLSEIVTALDAHATDTLEKESGGQVPAHPEALLALRELLKATEKGSLAEERCTAYEVEKSGLLNQMLHFLKHHAPTNADPIRMPTMNMDRWTHFRDVFSEQTKQTRKGLVRLMKALHAVVETGEAFPVWRHRKERGLKALTEPILLKLKYAAAGEGELCAPQPFAPPAMRPQVSVMVEPLVHMAELARYLVRVTPTADDRYLAYCHNLIGTTIRDKITGERATVMAFEVLQSDLPLPIHTVRRETSGESQRVLLGVRGYFLDGPISGSASLVEFRVALGKLHMIAGSDAYPGLLEAVAPALRGEPLAVAAAPTGEAVVDGAEGAAAAPAPPSRAVQQALQEAVTAAAGRTEEALAVLAEERTRLTPGGGANGEGAGGSGSSGEVAVDPTMRVHTVMIAVSDEIPFELFWPMVRDDIMGAVRELLPRGVNQQMEEQVQQGVAQNGMGPVAQRLTLDEAETLAARVGHVVQTAVTVDPQAVQEVQRERTKNAQNEVIPVAGRVQFSPKSGDSWAQAVVVGHGPTPVASRQAANERYDVIDDQGVLWEQLPRGRVRIPPGRRESPSSAGTPIQAVLSQADLVRIREHLRRRQEEWAERHAQLGAGGPGGSAGSAGGSGSSAAQQPDSAAASATGTAATGAGDPRGPASRPTSAPAAVAQRPRATSAGAIEGGGSRRVPSSDLLSRDGSLGDVDPSGALEMVHFIEEEGIGDEEFDDDGDGPRDPGEDGEEDDEDLPPLEPSEAGDSQGDVMLPPRLGQRSREGESRGEADGGGSMEEELRVLEQLRAMEQIISEVLDPHDGPRRSRRGDPGGSSEDFLNTPMGNLRIRMGGGAEGRVETYQIRRAGNSRGGERTGPMAMEPLRGDFPAFVRAADAPNPTSSLDHPVVERLGAADLVEEDTSADDPMEPLVEEACKPPQISLRFCLVAQAEPEPATVPASSLASTPPNPPPAAPAAPASADGSAAPAPAGPAPPPPQPPPAQPVLPPLALPASWNLLKAMQFLQDQQYLRSRADSDGEGAARADAAARAMGAPPYLVQALQKVPLENWCLGYLLEVHMPKDGSAAEADDSMGVGKDDMEVDASASQASARRKSAEADSPAPAPGRVAGLPAKKRRRMLSGRAAPDEVAREMYSRFTAEVPPEGGPATGPHRLIAGCGENSAVTDAIELLHLLKAQGPSLGIEASLWVSSKLDRKLRYQLEDPLSVVSGTLPLWAMTLPRLCPFLFSLKTRKMLLKYTAFGPSFAVHWMQESKVGSFLRRRATVQTELNAQTDPRKMQELSQELSNIEEHVVKSNFWLGTLQSTLVRMQKGDELLRQSDVAMELVSSASNLVEVQFDGETGFGSAVTQSFYVEVAQALQDRATNRRTPMWVEDDDSTNSQYLLCRRGLLVRPLVEGPQHDEAVRRFRFLGRLMGQALREGFIVPLPLAEEFFALVLQEPLGALALPRPGGGTSGELVGALADFAAELAAGEAVLVAEGRGSPEELQAWRREQAARMDFRERFLSSDQGEGSPTQSMSFDQYVSLAGVCFLETGLSGAPLCPGGDNVPVTVENVCDFVEKAANFWFEAGVSMQVEAFRAGLNDVFPFECLSAFSRSELREMFCGEDRIEWDEQALLGHLHPVGGLTDRSPTYKYLVAVLLEMNQAERSRFLDFVSSCPRLPPGGIAKFHVDVFPDSTATKQGFPRSRACANQLYLPPYGSKEELQEKLYEAMHCSAGHHEQRVRDQ